MPIIRSLFALSVFALSPVTLLGEDLLPVEAFASLPSMSQVRLSPNGENVVSLVKIDTEQAHGKAEQYQYRDVGDQKQGDAFKHVGLQIS